VFDLQIPSPTVPAALRVVRIFFLGGSPYGDLIFDRTGNLYGTTAFGGLGGGSVFELSPPVIAADPWTEITLFEFPMGLGGSRPWAGLVFGKAGRLFGTTFTGGKHLWSSSFGDGGCGTVFAVRP
jgi:hypothetical protein